MDTEKREPERDPVELIVAANVKHLRQQRGWTLRELESRVRETGHALAFSTLGKLETGKRPVHVGDLAALSKVFNLRPDELMVERQVAADLNSVANAINRLAEAKERSFQALEKITRVKRDIEAATAMLATLESVATEIEAEVVDLRQGLVDAIEASTVDTDEVVRYARTSLGHAQLLALDGVVNFGYIEELF